MSTIWSIVCAQVHNDRVSPADAAAVRCLVFVKHAGSVHGPGSEPQRQRQLECLEKDSSFIPTPTNS